MWKTVFFSSRKLAKSFTSSDFKRVTPGMTMAFHHERAGVTVDIADKTFVGIPFHVEGKRRMAVGMERAKGFVILYFQS